MNYATGLCFAVGVIWLVADAFDRDQMDRRAAIATCLQTQPGGSQVPVKEVAKSVLLPQ